MIEEYKIHDRNWFFSLWNVANGCLCRRVTVCPLSQSRLAPGSLIPRYQSSVKVKQSSSAKAVVDPAAAEWASALGALTVNGAILAGLSMAIRKANGFDDKDQVYAVDTPKKSASQEALINVSDPSNSGAKNAEEAQQWIAKWKARNVQEKNEATTSASNVIEAKKWIKAWRDSQDSHKSMISEDKKASDFQDTRKSEDRTLTAKEWIASWHAAQASTATEAITIPAVDSTRTSRVTEPSLPVSVGRNQVSNDSGEKENVSEHVSLDKNMLPVSNSSLWVANSDAAATETGYQKSLESQRTATAVLDKERNQEIDAKPKAPQRAVKVTEKYEEKIASLWENYEAKKAHESRVSVEQEKLTMDFKEIEKEIESKQRGKNGIVSFFLFLKSLIISVLRFVASILNQFTGKGSTSGTSLS